MAEKIHPQEQDKEWKPKDVWLAHHEKLLSATKDQQDAKVVFLGDSITEGWHGTGFKYWKENFHSYPSLNLGIGGDEVQHLHWRLINGEGDGVEPDVVVVLIGTNNIGNAGHDGETVIELLNDFFSCVQQKWPNAIKLVHTIFPRDEKPNTPFRREIQKVNQKIRQWAEEDRFTVLDLYDDFLKEGELLSSDEFPDFLHFTEGAYGKWASFLQPAIEAHLGNEEPSP